MPKNKKKERDLKFNKIPLEPAQEEELSEFTEIDESDLILENWQKMGNKMFLLNLGVKSADIKNYFEPRSVNKKLIYAAISYSISTGKKYSCTI